MSGKINEYVLEAKKVLVPTDNPKQLIFSISVGMNITCKDILQVIPQLIKDADCDYEQKQHGKTRQELIDSITVETCLLQIRSNFIFNQHAKYNIIQNNVELMFPDDVKNVTERVKNELISYYGEEFVEG